MTVCAGVDVGGTWVRVAVHDVTTGVRRQATVDPVPRTVGELTKLIQQRLLAHAQGDPVSSVGIGLPGHVLDRECVWVPNLRFLDGIALADLIENAVQVPCHLINDAQATLLAERADGAARGCDDVVLVAVGTGIGGAYQVGGRLVRGANGCAGSFGWMPAAGTAGDRDHGPWEQEASGRALEDTSARWGGPEGLIRHARTGAPEAMRAVQAFADALGRGFAGLASILDPEVIVFAGGLVAAFDLIAPTIRAAINDHASPSGRNARVVAAELGASAGVIGALYWGRDASAGGQASVQEVAP